MAEILTVWRAALRALLSNTFLWLEETVLAGALFGQVVYWLSLPVSTIWYILLHLVGVIVYIACLALMWRLARRSLFSSGLEPFRAAFRAAGPVALLLALGAPWLLITWIPRFESLGAQIASVVIRFVLAALIGTGAVLWWLACGARNSDEETS